MIDPAFLGMLVCPASRQPLREATAAELAAVNRTIAAGTARNRGGTAVAAGLAAGLVPTPGGVIYPIVDGIPILLSAEAIPIPDADGPAVGGPSTGPSPTGPSPKGPVAS